MPTTFLPNQGYALADIFMSAQQNAQRKKQMDLAREQQARQDDLAGQRQASQDKIAAEGRARSAAVEDRNFDYTKSRDEADRAERIAANKQRFEEARAKATGEAAPAAAASEFYEARQLRQAGQPGTVVRIAGEDRAIEVPPDVIAARAQADAAGAKIEAPQATDLRKELMSSPAFKAAQEVKAARAKVAGAPSSAVGDMSLIYGVMKLQDPGSTVREGEYANAENAKGVAGQVAGLYNRIVKGERLSDEQRQQFKAEANRLYGAQRATIDPQLAEFGKLAEREGIPSGDVVLDVWGERQRAPAAIAQQVAGPMPGGATPDASGQQAPPPTPQPRGRDVPGQAVQLPPPEAIKQQFQGDPMAAIDALERGKRISPEKARMMRNKARFEKARAEAFAGARGPAGGL